MTLFRSFRTLSFRAMAAGMALALATAGLGIATPASAAGTVAGARGGVTTLSVPLDIAPYLYRVTRSGADNYTVVVDPGFVGPGGAAHLIRPLCSARGKIPVGHKPSSIVIGNRGAAAVTALSYRVHCQ
ncbi:hypothetical protein [Frigidibacter sp. MR17.24]|uniref:hypothetical protein n=1 Tax=Frigidibacter sp. MR17.24 TaxID=3127345 RepID=UPI003012E289